MWKRGARASDREGVGSGPSIDRDRVGKRREVKFRVKGREGEGITYTLMSHLR
jgi:hypothetical protein